MALAHRTPTALSRDTARRFLTRHLRGDGVELGPGHDPYPVLPRARVRYVDRWRPGENREHFSELGDAPFPPIDIVAHFDRDRLAPIEDRSCDFVIASHVLEHLAEPIGFLVEIHRVLRPGGMALILLPDRRRTFDAGRAATPLEHLIDEYRAGTTEVADEHLIDYLTRAGDGASFLGVPDDPVERARWFAWHRERSIHVHCWSDEEFPAVIAYTGRGAGCGWELVDAMATDAEGPQGNEFGYVLRRAPDASDAAACAKRFEADWRSWRASGRTTLTSPPTAIAWWGRLALDLPAEGAVVNETFDLGGWALDKRGGIGSGIDAVEVWTKSPDAGDEDAVFAGVVAADDPRPDVAAAIGARGEHAGYNLTIGRIPAGSREVLVYAHSAHRDRFVASARRRVVVQPADGSESLP